MSAWEIADAIASATPRTTRNVCLIAHVDHGKTTFADSLLTANGVVSSRLAGKLRFMDSREDEQTRGITMKASVTSLVFPPLLVNLVDSPGHVDFVGEVADGLLLADTSLLLVDVVEGVCSQTEALLRRAVTQGQQVVLVLNKLDRLRRELQLSEADAFAHLKTTILAVNSCLSQVLRGLLVADESWSDIAAIEARMHFEPAQLNVLFASAAHSFAFSLHDFAEIYNERLGISVDELTKNLFEDCFLGPQKTICTDAAAKGKRSMFEQLVLGPLWQLFDAGQEEKELPRLVALAEKLGIQVKSKRVAEALDEVMRAWLPLPRATFRVLARCSGAAAAMQGRRLGGLLGLNANTENWDGSTCSASTSHPLEEAIIACDATAQTVVFVTKLVQIAGRRLAIVRVFSGRLEPGQELNCLSPAGKESQVRVSALCLMRGRELLPLDSVPAGVVCALESEQPIPAMSTLTEKRVQKGFVTGRNADEPLVRVRISVRKLEEEEKLREALKNLALFDATVRIVEQENGELALLTSGEVHLQKCLHDLATDAGLTELDVSEPVVPFLETTVADPALTAAQISEHVTECRKGDDSLHLRLRVVPLSAEVAAILELLAPAMRGGGKGEIAVLKERLLTAAASSLAAMKGSWWYRMPEASVRAHFERAWSLGPEKAPANLLFNSVEGYERKPIWNDSSTYSGVIRDFDAAVVAGFELFVAAGPLCNEPMHGVGVVVEKWSLDEQEPGIGGQLMSAAKATCTAAAKKTPLRLVAATYEVTVATAAAALGKVHAVLAQRKAKVLSEDVDEISNLFVVRARMPVIESFSFCDQLRKKTSGLATGQLAASKWQIIDEDPYWEPRTEEEIEEFGVKGDSPNHAKGYMDTVRRRKGLPTEDLIVVSAEKQRNLGRNK